MTVIGLGEALHRPAFIAAYVLGFGSGTALAIEIKRGRWKRAAHCENNFTGCTPTWLPGCRCNCGPCAALAGKS